MRRGGRGHSKTFSEGDILNLLTVVLSVVTFASANPTDANANIASSGSGSECWICSLVEEQLVSFGVTSESGTQCKESDSEFSHVDCLDNQTHTYCTVAPYAYCYPPEEVLSDGSFTPQDEFAAVLKPSGPNGAWKVSSCGALLARTYDLRQSDEIFRATKSMTM